MRKRIQTHNFGMHYTPMANIRKKSLKTNYQLLCVRTPYSCLKQYFKQIHIRNITFPPSTMCRTSIGFGCCRYFCFLFQQFSLNFSALICSINSSIVQKVFSFLIMIPIDFGGIKSYKKK